MIVGIGTDIVNIKRIENIYKKFGEDFLNKNFHSLEIERFKKLNDNLKLNYLAKRFAAKEAVAKALGTGIKNGLKFKDIAVINNDLGSPRILISSECNPNIKKYNIHISLSDDEPFAVAFAIIVK